MLEIKTRRRLKIWGSPCSKSKGLAATHGSEGAEGRIPQHPAEAADGQSRLTAGLGKDTGTGDAARTPRTQRLPKAANPAPRPLPTAAEARHARDRETAATADGLNTGDPACISTDIKSPATEPGESLRGWQQAKTIASRDSPRTEAELHNVNYAPII